jgi:hypothetical protein
MSAKAPANFLMSDVTRWSLEGEEGVSVSRDFDITAGKPYALSMRSLPKLQAL